MLNRFERFMEDAFEGRVRRAFSTRLQPVQVAKAAARAMEDAQVVGLRGPEVPNVYVVRLSAEDYERFSEYQATLANEVSEYLVDYSRDRGLRPVAPVKVEILAEPAVRTGSVRVDARFRDETHADAERFGALEEALEGTRRLRLEVAQSAGVASEPVPAATWLEDEEGQRYPLEPADGVVRLGRSLDNDVVLTDQRVSRYHAQLRWDGRAWHVHDLGSTNGTFVDEQQVREAPVRLRPGSRLRFGGQTLLLGTDEPS